MNNMIIKNRWNFLFLNSLLAIILFFPSNSAFGGACKAVLVCSKPQSLSCKQVDDGHAGVPSTFEAWKELLQSAKSNIDIDMTYITHPEGKNPKANELLRIIKEKAEKEGVKVRLFADGNISTFPGYEGTEYFPQGKNIEIVKTPKSDKFKANHKKMIMIDGGKRAYVGSANFDANLLEDHVGDCGYIIDGPVAKDAQDIFNHYFDHFSGVTRATALSSESGQCEDVQLVCSHFQELADKLKTPSTLETLVKLIRNASSTIDLQMYYMNFEVDPYDEKNANNSAVILSKALNEKCKSGIEINISFDSDSFTKKGQDETENKKIFFEKMRKFLPDCNGKDNLHLKVVHVPQSKSANYPPQVHSKFMIIDKKTAWVGSENWPDSTYFDGNSNCGLVVSSAQAVSQLRNVFQSYWNCGNARSASLNDVPNTVKECLAMTEKHTRDISLILSGSSSRCLSESEPPSPTLEVKVPSPRDNSKLKQELKEILAKIQEFPKFDEDRLLDPEYILGLFEQSKVNLAARYLNEEHLADRKTHQKIKAVSKNNAELKKQIIQKFANSPSFQDVKAQTMKGLLLALPGSGHEVSETVRKTLSDMIRKAPHEERKAIGEYIRENLNNRNIKIRYFALSLLKKHFPEKLPSEDMLADAMNPFHDKEISEWILSDPKTYNPKNFAFLIHGVTTDALNSIRNPGKKDQSSDDDYKTAFQDPKVFLNYKRIATSLIGVNKEKGISDVRTFSPVGVILNVPRENIAYASKRNFASDGRYIPRIYKDLPSPNDLLVNPETKGKYNEITVEGTSPVSGRKTEITGVYIKEGTPQKHRKEAEDFAKKNHLPIVEIPEKWIVNPFFAPNPTIYYNDIE